MNGKDIRINAGINTVGAAKKPPILLAQTKQAEKPLSERIEEIKIKFYFKFENTVGNMLVYGGYDGYDDTLDNKPCDNQIDYDEFVKYKGDNEYMKTSILKDMIRRGTITLEEACIIIDQLPLSQIGDVLYRWPEFAAKLEQDNPNKFLQALQTQNYRSREKILSNFSKEKQAEIFNELKELESQSGMSRYETLQKRISKVEDALFSRQLTERELCEFKDELINIESDIINDCGEGCIELKIPLCLTKVLLAWRLQLYWTEKSIAAEKKAPTLKNKKDIEANLKETRESLILAKVWENHKSEFLGIELHKLIKENPDYFSKHPDMEFKYNYHSMMGIIVTTVQNGGKLREYYYKEAVDKAYKFNPENLKLHRQMASVYGLYSEIVKGGAKIDYDAELEKYITQRPEDPEGRKLAVQISYNRCIAALWQDLKEEAGGYYAEMQSHIKMLMEKFPNDDEGRQMEKATEFLKEYFK